MKKKLLALTGLIYLTGCATMGGSQNQAPSDLTKEHFKDTATIKDDPLDTVATITTENGYQEKHGLLGIVWNDNFLRGFIDKKTGKKTFQVYESLPYNGSSWKFFQTVDYETPSGPQSQELTIINRDAGSCGGPTGCFFSEHVGFNVGENLLRAIAKNYSPTESRVWNFKFDPKSGDDFRDKMYLAEVAGFLEAVDGYLANKAFPNSAATSSTKTKNQ